MSLDEINPGEGSLALGFIEDTTESWLLQSKFFPSKVLLSPYETASIILNYVDLLNL